jgi:hypothetical protein
VITGRRSRLLPAKWKPIKVTLAKSGGEMQGKFAFLMVTTLQRLLFSGQMPATANGAGAMQLLVIERSLPALLRAFVASLRGTLGGMRLAGVHLERGDEIRIEGGRSSVLLDGELFEADVDRPIVLRPTAPVPFLKLAA